MEIYMILKFSICWRKKWHIGLIDLNGVCCIMKAKIPPIGALNYSD